MAFVLFSVAGLACEFQIQLLRTNAEVAVVVRFVGLSMYMIIRLFAGE
jgi:hypothetical protein